MGGSLAVRMECLNKEYVVRKPTGRFGFLRAAGRVYALKDFSLEVRLGESIAFSVPTAQGRRLRSNCSQGY